MILELLIGGIVATGIFGGIKKLNDAAGSSVLKKRGVKCPHCGGNELNMKGTFRDYSNGITCKSCGHKFTIYNH